MRLSYFSYGSSILVELEFGNVGFVEGGISNLSHIGGRHAFSPLCHPCSPKIGIFVQSVSFVHLLLLLPSKILPLWGIKECIKSS